MRGLSGCFAEAFVTLAFVDGNPWFPCGKLLRLIFSDTIGSGASIANYQTYLPATTFPYFRGKRANYFHENHIK